MVVVSRQIVVSCFVIDVGVAVGEVIAVLFGPSGSGKTSILHSIAGLSPVKDGYVLLKNLLLMEDGKRLIPVHEQNIGYMFQDYALFPHMTVWENISYGMKSESFARNLMEQLEVDHLTDEYPHEISGGEKQRIALIRAFATKPDLLLLDEPFASLDDQTREKSRKQLLDIHKQWRIPMILVTHNRKDANILADQRIFIEKGRLIK